MGVYLFLVVLYVNGRFDWRWLNGDAVSLTRLSANLFAESTLLPSQGAYPFGYAYPTLNAFLAHFTGLSIPTIQTYLQPFLIILLLPASFIAFRSLVNSSHVAMLATLLLFLQPDFLFEILRSSHAKLTYLLALLMLFLLARSFQSSNPGRPSWSVQPASAFAACVLAFYLVVYALIASNSYFALNYIFAIGFVFLAVLVFKWLLPHLQTCLSPRLAHLWMVSLSCIVLAVLFIFFFYPPALRQFSTLQTVIDQVASLFLGVEQTTSPNPYTYVDQVWLTFPVYLSVSAANWLVLAFSLGFWLYQGYRFIVQRKIPSPPALLLWLLYAAFACLLAIAVLLDFSGALSSNLQVRHFPHLMLFAVPLAASLVHLLLLRLPRPSRLSRFTTTFVLSLLIAYLSLASLLKVTNEPSLSNWWAFYTPAEKHLVVWTGQHASHAHIWMGADRRLATVTDAFAFQEYRSQGLVPETTPLPHLSRYSLLSDLLLAHAHRLHSPLPDLYPHFLVYHNGSAWLYYHRPLIPYQP